MPGAIRKAQEIVAETEGAFLASQFENLVNPKIHYETTGPEIYEATDGNIDILVSGIGTGGTITGAGKYLKEQNPNIQMIAVEPSRSPVLSTGQKGKHKIQGIGAGFVPNVLNTEIYSDIVLVTDEDAMNTSKHLSQTNGIFVGISAGAAVWAALEVAKRPENSNKTLVVIIPDNGDRYLSMMDYDN